jgi:hypothetical protein
MTEAEWLACAEPQPMLAVLNWGHRASDRKFQLFTASCYRDSLRLTALNDTFYQATFILADATEAYADGILTQADWEAIYQGLEVKIGGDRPEFRGFDHAFDVSGKVALLAGWDGCIGFDKAEETEQERRNIRLIREIFGNPFRPVVFSPSWRTDTAVSLARQMYDARDFSAMPILADALQDAGMRQRRRAESLSRRRSARAWVLGCRWRVGKGVKRTFHLRSDSISPAPVTRYNRTEPAPAAGHATRFGHEFHRQNPPRASQ